MVSFNAQKNNSKLTDFEGLKDFVVDNTVRAIPRVIKLRAVTNNSMLSEY